MWVPSNWPISSSHASISFLNTLLRSFIIKYSRFISYFSWPSSGISHFSEVSQVLLVGNGIRNQDLTSMCVTRVRTVHIVIRVSLLLGCFTRDQMIGVGTVWSYNLKHPLMWLTTFRPQGNLSPQFLPFVLKIKLIAYKCPTLFSCWQHQWQIWTEIVKIGKR